MEHEHFYITVLSYYIFSIGFTFSSLVSAVGGEWWDSGYHLTTAIVGRTILTLPYAFKGGKAGMRMRMRPRVLLPQPRGRSPSTHTSSCARWSCTALLAEVLLKPLRH
ncbi:hypothetical protein SAY86_000187 [Trapa natans]|uniref:Uncharacterized protein n=1 Tax=Trapa natans TaxID=22666 RepID=A0AAN7MAG3_TRANT|nr:hypothetical protein SAY86_000187 [Trapa natans]